MGRPNTPPDATTPEPSSPEAARLQDLSSRQWKSGAAAWLGWLFDGLDMHLYVLVAAPFVAELLDVASEKDPLVGYYSSWIQAAFLIGWALGGGFFGRVADRLGRSRALTLTILTLLVCALALTAHWAFLFWFLQHLRNLPDLGGWTDAEKSQLVSKAVWLVTLASIAGNFLAGGLARWLKYRRAIACLCLAY